MNELYPSACYKPFGDRAIVVGFGNVISREVNQRVHALHYAVSNAKLLGVGECVPTYRSLLVTYDSTIVTYQKLVSMIKNLEKGLGACNSKPRGRKAVIPVVYGGVFGPDLTRVSLYHNLKERDVIRVHSEREYVVYMIGFTAGFPYLGELAEEIATPRLENPRKLVPEGSVGIAGRQTGIYPRKAPGGWQIIGRTPIQLFDPSWSPPALIQPGDCVKFEPISTARFRQIRSAASRGDYSPFVEE